MITDLIKKVKKFYEEVNSSDLRKLSLEELERLQKQVEEFYEFPELRKHETELEKYQSYLLHDVVSMSATFFVKGKYRPYYMEYIDKALSINLEDIEALKEFLQSESMSAISRNARITAESLLENSENTTLIITSDDLSTYNYLYYYGRKVTDNHRKIVDFMNSLEEDAIIDMAKCTIDAFMRGVEHSNIDKSQKDSIFVYYPIGFEKVARRINELLAGKFKVLFRVYDSTSFSKQLEHNHRYDWQAFFTREYVEKSLSFYEEELGKNTAKYKKNIGRIYIETFGEDRFLPVNGNEIFENNRDVNILYNEYDVRYVNMFNRLVRIDDSFCIISYPCPEIGECFEEVFKETIAINNMDNARYQIIQQHIIDVLDRAVKVHVTGRNGNKTDITVSLITLSNPEKETIFENCTADVNVPVGEVFTSPRLEGTNGILNVSEIYLNGMLFKDLYLEIEDGFVRKYSCSNYDSEQENKTYVEENLLFLHPTLPMGEFAIGTNTKAYMMIQKYDISSKMDILIAEKTGPHFAFGDTCYSHEEDKKVYNPDGKEIVARDNEVSRKRKDNPEKAYFGCHTDVTIPYSELGDVVAIDRNGKEVKIISNGKFVLPGTEELNIEGM